MPVYAAVLKRAPAGIIAQAHEVSRRDPDFFELVGGFLNATGEWCTNEMAALATLLDDVDHEIELAEGRIERQLAKVEREKRRLAALRSFKSEHVAIEDPGVPDSP